MPKTATKKKRRSLPRKKKTARKTNRAPTASPRRKTSQRTGKQIDPLELVMELMAIRGKSGDEKAVSEFIVRHLVAAAAKKSAIKFDSAHKKTPINGQIGNLIFQIPGTRRGSRVGATGGARRLLMAHMDTVPICVGCQPVRKGKLVKSADPATGLGADNRAGCAVILNAAMRILREQPEHPPLTFFWTIQEEIGLHGARHVRVSALGNPPLAFNWDGGDPAKLTTGATGGYRMQIEIEGVASHAGNAPEQGVSAIAIASVAIADLQARGWHGLIVKKDKRGTANIGVIQGGNATNVVTDHVSIRAEARSHDPKFRKKIVKEIEKSFERAARQVKSVNGNTGRVIVDGRLDYESFKLDKREPCVLAAKAAVRAAGANPVTSVTNGGVDANWMAVHGVPTVTLGCGQMNPHTVKETLNVAQFETACEIGWRLAIAAKLADA